MSKIKLPTKSENAKICRGIYADKDNPAWTARDFARARPAREVVPDIVAKYEGSKRGRPAGRSKAVVSISLDKDVVAALKAKGKGWQTRLNDLLRAVLEVRS